MPIDFRKRRDGLLFNYGTAVLKQNFLFKIKIKIMIRAVQSPTNSHQDDEKYVERSFSSQNIHLVDMDIVHLMIDQSKPHINRSPTVDEELFSELLAMGKKPICICGRALIPIKKRFVGLHCRMFQDANIYPSCDECKISLGPDLGQVMDIRGEDRFDDQNNGTLYDDIIWLCPSKELYPHLFGFFLCRTCCVDQMLSNRWTKQFSSTNSILNFMLTELENLEQRENEKEMIEINEEINHRLPLRIDSQPVTIPTANGLEAAASTTDTMIGTPRDMDITPIPPPDPPPGSPNSAASSPKKSVPRKSHRRSPSKVLTKLNSKIDLNLRYRSDKDLLSIDGKEKYIAVQLMIQRQKELANIFAKLYDLHQFQTLLEFVCSDIVDFEFNYKFNDKLHDMTYFENIIRMTAWTEIRQRLHKPRIEWNAQRVVWEKGLKKFLNSCCYCIGKNGSFCSPNDDEFECCWARIQFGFMGSVRLGYVPLLFRYGYITLISLILIDWSLDYTLYHDYFYYGFVGIAGLELLILNYLHHFNTMFKLKTILKWGYRKVLVFGTCFLYLLV